MWLHNASEWLVEEYDIESHIKLYSKKFKDYNEALYEFQQREGNTNTTTSLNKVPKQLLVE